MTAVANLFAPWRHRRMYITPVRPENWDECFKEKFGYFTVTIKRGQAGLDALASSEALLMIETTTTGTNWILINLEQAALVNNSSIAAQQRPAWMGNAAYMDESIRWSRHAEVMAPNVSRDEVLQYLYNIPELRGGVVHRHHRSGTLYVLAGTPCRW